jgi:hypothetical protein
VLGWNRGLGMVHALLLSYPNCPVVPFHTCQGEA